MAIRQVKICDLTGKVLPDGEASSSVDVHLQLATSSRANPLRIKAEHLSNDLAADLRTALETTLGNYGLFIWSDGSVHAGVEINAVEGAE